MDTRFVHNGPLKSYRHSFHSDISIDLQSLTIFFPLLQPQDRPLPEHIGAVCKDQVVYAPP